jgi:beta-N-acetylhexosaminidase
VIESVGEHTSLWDRKRRAGQRLLLGIAGTAPTVEEKELIAETQPCGFVLFARNIEEPAQVRELNRELAALLPASAPPLLTVDQEGGRVQRIRATPWPAMRTVGNADDTTRTKALARAIGDEVRALGFNVDWAPVADVDSNPKNPVIGDRSFSNDPARVAKHVVAFLEGMRASGCIACVKHFPGHGDTMLDSHTALPRVEKDRDEVQHVELVPFAAAVRAGVPMVMSAHVVFPAWDEDRPATLSSVLLRDLLRRDLVFAGVLVSDDLDMKAVADQFAIQDVVEQASLATVDLFLSCKDRERQWALYEALVRVQEPSKLHEDRAIDAMTRLRVLRETHLRSPPPPPDLSVVGSAAHRDLAFALLAAGGV